jgi:hypothetical protein
VTQGESTTTCVLTACRLDPTFGTARLRTRVHMASIPFPLRLFLILTSSKHSLSQLVGSAHVPATRHQADA